MENIIHRKIRVDCPPQRAFEMFTVNRHIVRWLAPKADVKPEAGGRFHLFWDTKDLSKDNSRGCRITAIEHGRFLAFEWKSFERFSSFMDDADPKTHCTVFFMPDKESRKQTDIHLIHTGWRTSEQWQEARDWYDEAWKNALGELKNLLKKE